MSKLPLVSSIIFEKLLLSLGFEVRRRKGSHVFYRHSDGRYTTLPHHKDRMIGRSLTREILRQIKLSPEEYIELLNKS